MSACPRGACVRGAAPMDAEHAAVLPAERAARSEFRWSHAGPVDIHGHVARPVVMHLDRFDARTVLDVGCGNGWLTAALARCAFDVTGMDNSESGIAIARRNHPDVPFLLDDAMQPPRPELRGRYDAVVAVEVIDHVAQPRQLLRQVRQLLRPGGLLLVSTPYHGYLKNLGLALSDRFDLRLQALEDHGRLKFFSRATLSALVADCGFEIQQIQHLGRVPPIARSILVAAHRTT